MPVHLQLPLRVPFVYDELQLLKACAPKRTGTVLVQRAAILHAYNPQLLVLAVLCAGGAAGVGLLPTAAAAAPPAHQDMQHCAMQ